MVEAGMDVARLNFSHADHAVHAETAERVRAAADRAGRPVAILQDLPGPKLRIGELTAGTVELKVGDHVTFVCDPDAGPGDERRMSVSWPGLVNAISPGEVLYLADGAVRLRTTEVRPGDRELDADVEVGGSVSTRQGLNIPGPADELPAVPEEDLEHLRAGLAMGVDMVALSFVRSPADIDLVHQVMDRVGRGRLPVVAKIEKPEAVDNLEAIVLAFDGIMVARGDLGVELPLEQVPLVQKRAIQIARENAKPVIVATQMLDSMINNPRPTRAETSDVANAVLDGADAVMLSGETSVGRYPIETVETMARIICAVENESVVAPPLTHVPRTKRGVISYAARDIGERLNAKALVAFTQSGDTLRRLARLHTRLPLLAFTPDPHVRSQLALTWGTETFLVPSVDSTDAMVRQVDLSMLSIGRYQPGDLVVIVAGSPPGTVGSTNLIRVHRLGEEDHA
jgi:pyruvate kinase